MIVLTISGKARAGKDTVAGMLREKMEAKGKKVLIMHYADLLKYLCTSLFGWDGNKDEKGRTLLQYVGTEIVREKEPDFWVDFVEHILHLFDGEWDFVLIPDARFPNEVERLRESSFRAKNLRIDREGYDNGLTPEQKAHPSETSVDLIRYDYIIRNIGTLEDLDHLADEFIVIAGWLEMGYI